MFDSMLFTTGYKLIIIYHQKIKTLVLHKLPLEKDDFTNFQTFGYQVWVQPPGKHQAKFQPNSQKGIFLGYLPNKMKNILCYDVETNWTKLAKHA